MIINGFVWLIIVVFSLFVIDMTDTWTRKTRKAIDNIFAWVQKNNLKMLSSIILLIILGILAQLEIIPKLIT